MIELTQQQIKLYAQATKEIWGEHLNLDKLKNIIKEDKAILEEIKEKQSLLTIAIRAADSEVIELLLGYNIDVKRESEVSYLYTSKYLPKYFNYFLEKGVKLKPNEEVELEQTHSNLYAKYIAYKEKEELENNISTPQKMTKMKL